MTLIQGQTIKLFSRVQTGLDAFNAPIYEEIDEDVENVLVCPASTEAVQDGLQLYGKHTVYELMIPKNDTHQWKDRNVSFFGERWKTFGDVLTWPDHLAPGQWNRKVRVERYG